MVIRPAQMDAFRCEAGRQFRAGLEQHLCEFAPELTRAAGRPNVKRVIDLGIEKAGTFGFTERATQTFYLELMLTFGSYFASDPVYGWATRILELDGQGGQSYRAGVLSDSTCLYLERINGPHNTLLKAALKRVREAPIDSYLRSEMPIDRLFCSVFFDLYPEKAEFVGVESMSFLVREAEDTAKQYRMDLRRGTLTLALLILLLGRGAARDPMYPWVEAALRDDQAQSESGRLLYTIGMRHVDKAIQTLSKET